MKALDSAPTATCPFAFMRCGKCGRICTKTEMERALGFCAESRACPCGSLKYAATDVTWRDYVLPQVLRFLRTQFSDVAILDDMRMEAESEGLSATAIERHLSGLQSAMHDLAPAVIH